MKPQELFYELFVSAEIVEDPGTLRRILFQDTQEIGAASDIMNDQRKTMVIGELPVPVKKLDLIVEGLRIGAVNSRFTHRPEALFANQVHDVFLELQDLSAGEIF